MNTKLKYFAKNLRHYRKEAGLTQEELGTRISYSDKAVSKWETGRVYPPTEALLKLAETLNLDLDALFAPRSVIAYYLGVDGGGTKTHFLLTDTLGNTVNRVVLGPCNMVNMDKASLRKVLTEGIEAVCGDRPRDQIAAFFGLAGITFAATEKVESVFRGLGFGAVGWGADAENTVSAGLKGLEGLIAIMGTGSVVFSSMKGKLKRFGGYGHLLGDYASGYEIGKEGLYAVLNDTNGSGPHTVLRELFEKQTGSGINDQLMGFYEKGKPYIASFAPLVFEAARKGDPMARQILQENVRRFAPHLRAALAQFDQKEPIPLVFSGSITRSFELLKPYFEEELADFSVQIGILQEDPVQGAVRLASLLGEKE